MDGYVKKWNDVRSYWVKDIAIEQNTLGIIYECKLVLSFLATLVSSKSMFGKHPIK
jgi:hypothetical protein